MASSDLCWGAEWVRARHQEERVAGPRGEPDMERLLVFLLR
jgi:hypothetical protein